ncbi:alkaline phosphatase family protein [Teredinibacter turnerae]|uniref:alkaline phosphatase family protein n=1 Tax=Teredinibacter turnerae TaxID=2426 RepID=UPI0003739FC1|nr:alkaline phosphatase family protein [Teredinibacter turnerae]
MKNRFLALLLLTLCLPVYASDNLILVTIDGLRWQEVFHGIDSSLATNKAFSSRSEKLLTDFGGEHSAEKLMPFFHNTLAHEGALYGNKDAGECMQLRNPWFFSYPGYNEILTGSADPAIDSNSKKPNPNTTILEWLNQQSQFKGQVYAFGSWDVFPFIINEERSKVPVNAGFRSAKFHKLTAMEKMLNELQGKIPSPWETVRLDAFTHHYALETLKQRRPRVLYIAYGETDDFAHDGEYDQYVLAAHRTDQFIAELWQTVQSSEHYRDNTTLIVTTDHGRGSTQEDWQHHASKAATQGYMKSLAHFKEGIIGANDVWFAAIGPRISSQLKLSDSCLSTNQIAATAVKVLGFDWQKQNSHAGDALPIMKESGL